MAQALYRKWRSRTFDEVVGQEHVTQTLRNALRDNRVAHAYLFSGPRGTGKTSTARILAKALNCTGPADDRPCDVCPTCVAISEGRMLDLIEIDAASNNSVDDVRELRDKVGFRPSEGSYKIYIIDEVHMLSTNAFNALLKTLEEPPPHARFILATTEPHKIPATVHSRCQRFDFRRIPVVEIAAHLRHIATEENIAAEDGALTAIARSAQGCMRDAISLLDQMTSYGAEAISLEQVHDVLGSVASESVSAFVDALAEQNVATGLRLIHSLLLGGASLQEFTTQVVEHLRGVLLLQMTADSGLLDDRSPETVKRMQVQAQKLTQPQTLYAVKRFGEAIGELKGGYQPQLPLELALIEIVRGPVAAAVQAPVAQPVVVQPVAVQPVTAKAAVEEKKASPPAPEVTAAQSLPVPLDQNAVSKLRAQWNDVLVAVRERSGLKQQAALRAVRDIAIGENAIALAFGNNKFARDMISDPETMAQVSAILAQFVGRQVGVECLEGETATLSAAAGRALRDDRKTDGPDPLLAFAVSELGAQVQGEKGGKRKA
ncbi:MAG: DNA polymerase III subunit gamma/tau [Chloroflexi bacterium]|nr:MAG: DNA polymerase III subunit gamma/tau [Chloroflexota bacterium]